MIYISANIAEHLTINQNSRNERKCILDTFHFFKKILFKFSDYRSVTFQRGWGRHIRATKPEWRQIKWCTRWISWWKWLNWCCQICRCHMCMHTLAMISRHQYLPEKKKKHGQYHWESESKILKTGCFVMSHRWSVHKWTAGVWFHPVCSSFAKNEKNENK